MNELFNMWRTYNKRLLVPLGYKDFQGVSMEDMSSLEECFNVKIKLYYFNQNGAVTIMFDSISLKSDIVCMNVHENHLSYTTNFNQFIKKFECAKCSKLFKRELNMKTHNKNFLERTKLVFPGGFHNTNHTIFEKLQSLNIDIPEEDRYYPYYAVWDMEAVLLKTESE